jgi:two-component system sensor histidine kinase UhpB
MAKDDDILLAKGLRGTPPLRHLASLRDGLWSAMESYAHEFLNEAGLRGQIVFNVALHTPVPEPMLATAAFRLFREALTNVMRHAQASVVQIDVSADPRALVISITDDGRGVTRAQLRNPATNGIRGMSECAHYFYGKLEVGPAFGGGTRVRILLPLSPYTEVNGNWVRLD